LFDSKYSEAVNAKISVTILLADTNQNYEKNHEKLEVERPLPPQNVGAEESNGENKV
jgi:hypothetical protein